MAGNQVRSLVRSSERWQHAARSPVGSLVDSLVGCLIDSLIGSLVGSLVYAGFTALLAAKMAA